MFSTEENCCIPMPELSKLVAFVESTAVWFSIVVEGKEEGERKRRKGEG